MKTIKEHYPTIRSAVEGMINGLRGHTELGLQINMGTYGGRIGDVCFGCAATCAVLNADPSLPIHQTDRELKIEDIIRFETCINEFRLGYAWSLQSFYGLKPDDRCQNWCLTNKNWEEQLPLIEEWLNGCGY